MDTVRAYVKKQKGKSGQPNKNRIGKEKENGRKRIGTEKAL